MYSHYSSRYSLCIALVLVSLIWLASFDQVGAPEVQPPWVDFAILSVGMTPSAPVAGDLVIFYAKVQILQTNNGLIQWVDVRCLLDGDLRYEGSFASGVDVVGVYSQKPWNATWGAHVVTWVVDPSNQFNDPNLENNLMQYSFAVGEPRRDFDFSISVYPNWQVANFSQSASYEISIYMNRVRMETVYLSLSGVPSGVVHSFSKSSGNSSYSSRLDLECDAVPTGIYYMEVNASAQTASHPVTLILLVEPKPIQSNSNSISLTILSHTSTFSPIITQNTDVTNTLLTAAAVTVALIGAITAIAIDRHRHSMASKLRKH